MDEVENEFLKQIFVDVNLKRLICENKKIEIYEFLSVFTLKNFLTKFSNNLYEVIPQNLMILEIEKINLFKEKTKNVQKFQIEFEDFEGYNYEFENLKISFVFRKLFPYQFDFQEITSVESVFVFDGIKTDVEIDFYSQINCEFLTTKITSKGEKLKNYELDNFEIIKNIEGSSISETLKLLETIEKKQILNQKKKFKFLELNGKIVKNFFSIQEYKIEFIAQKFPDFYEPLMIFKENSQIMIKFEKYFISSCEQRKKYFKVFYKDGSFSDVFFHKLSEIESKYNFIPVEMINHPNNLLTYDSEIDSNLNVYSTNLISITSNLYKSRFWWEINHMNCWTMKIKMIKFFDENCYIKISRSNQFYSDHLNYSIFNDKGLTNYKLKFQHLIDEFGIPFDNENLNFFTIINVKLESKYIIFEGYYNSIEKEIFLLKILYAEEGNSELHFRSKIHLSLIIDLKRNIQELVKKKKLLDINIHIK